MNLLELPAEIRNRIFELVLTSGKPLLVRRKDGPGFRHPNRALLQVCRLTRTDGLGLYYSNNQFIISSNHDLGDWLDVVGHSYVHLQDLTLADGSLDSCDRVCDSDTWRKATRAEVKLVLVEGTVVVHAVDGLVTDDFLSAAVARLGPTAKFLQRLDRAHRLMICGSIAHCFHCAHGHCSECRTRNDCCNKT